MLVLFRISLKIKISEGFRYKKFDATINLREMNLWQKC